MGVAARVVNRAEEHVQRPLCRVEMEGGGGGRGEFKSNSNSMGRDLPGEFDSLGLGGHVRFRLPAVETVEQSILRCSIVANIELFCKII